MAEKFVLTAQLNLQAPTNVKQVLSSMKKDLKSVSVDIDVKKGSEAVKKLNQVAKATKEVESSAKKASTGADKMGRAFGGALKNVLKYDLARRVFSAFTNTIEQGLQDAIAFERAMIKIAQVSGSTIKQLKGLEQTVTRLSTSLGVSSAGLVKIGLILKQTGLSVNDTKIAMEALAKTELAPTFDNITNTAETAIAALRQFRLEASQLEGLLGKINTVAANFAVEASDIGVAIKRAGGAFRSAGGEVEELIALFTSVRATTRETAETIATGFRTIFTRMQRPTTIKFLRQFGVELTDLQGKFVGPFEAVKRLSNALQGLESTDLRFSAIVEQLGGFRQVSKVIPLIQEFSTAQDAMNKQLSAGGSLAKDAEMAQASLAVQMMKLSENVKELFREIANSTAFKEMAKFALMAANAAVTLGKALAPIIPLITAMMAFRAVKWGGGKMFGGGGGLKNAMFGGGGGGGGGGMGMGFSGGGRVRRFSNGGWVPGSGNGDTVPAMLEPGEFVLRKSAAQAYGSQLNGVNKYAAGGKAVTVKGTSLRSFSGDGMANLFSEPGKKRHTHRVGRNNPWSMKDPMDQFNPGESFSVQNEHQLIDISSSGLKGLLDRDLTSLKKFKGIGAGNAWEKALKSSKTLIKEEGSSPALDGKIGGMLGDAAISASAHSDSAMAGKAFRHMLHADKPGFLQKFGTTSDDDEFNFGMGKQGSVFEFLPNKLKLLPKINDILAKRRLARKGKKKTKSSPSPFTNVTSVPGGFADGGEVPALLTPGEFVVNKKSAQSMGYGKLRKMNKYAGGGTVQKFGAGDIVGGGGMGMGGMMMPMMMTNMMESTGKATKGIYGMGEGAMGAYFKMNMFSAALGMGMDAMGQQEGATREFTDVLMQAATILGTIKGGMGAGGGAGMLSQAADVGMAASMFQGGGIKGAATRMGGKALAGGAKGIKGVATQGVYWSAVTKREAIASKAATRVLALEKAKNAAVKTQSAAQKELIKLTQQKAKWELRLKTQTATGKTARTQQRVATNAKRKAGALAKSMSIEKRAAQFKVGNAKTGWKMPKYQRNIDPRFGHEGKRAVKSAGVAGKEAAMQGRKALAAEKSAASLAKNLAEADKAILANKNALTKSAKTIATSTKSIPKLAKMGKAAGMAVKGLKALNPVALILGIAVERFGDQMNEAATKSMKDQVKSGKLTVGGMGTRAGGGSADERKLRSKATMGGGISGAATGAGIGALIGGFTGPFAIALVPLFAAVGGVVGFFIGAANAAENFQMALEKAHFEKSMDDMSEAMEKFTNGTMTNASAIRQVTTTLSTIQATTGGAGVKGSAKGFGAVAKNTELLFKSMGKNVDSMDEFESTLKHTFGPMREQGMLQNSLIKEIRAETEARLDSQEKMKDWAQAQIDAAKGLAHLKGIAGVFDVVSERVKNFGEVVQAIANPLSNITMGGGIEAGLNSTGRDKDSVARFNKSVDSMSNMAGERDITGLGGFNQTVKDQGFLEREMANILTVASAGSATGDIKSDVQAQLDAALEAEGHGMSQDMRDHFDKALDAMDTADLKDMSKLEQNVSQFTAAHAEYLETFKKGAKLLDDHNKNLMTMYAAKNKLEIQGVKNTQAIQSARFKSEQNYLKGIAAPGVDFQTSQADVDSDFSGRQQTALKEVGSIRGVDATTMGGDVDAIGKAYQQVSIDLRKSNKDLQNQGLDGVDPGAGRSLATETNKDIEANAKLRKQYELLGGVLDKYKNTQERLVAINEKIANEQKWQDSLEDLAFNLAYGTAEEKEDSAYLVNQIEKARAAGKVRGVVDPEMERTVAKFLKTSGMQGGQEAIANEISGVLHEAGAAFTSAVGNAFAGITAPTERMLKLQEQALGIEAERIAAMEAEGGELSSRAEGIGKAITDANKQFLDDLRKLLTEEKTGQMEEDVAIGGSEIKGLQKELAVLKKIGLDPTGKTDAQKNEMKMQLDYLKTEGQQYIKDKEAKDKMLASMGGQVQYRGRDISDAQGMRGINWAEEKMGDRQMLDMTKIFEGTAGDSSWLNAMDNIDQWESRAIDPSKDYGDASESIASNQVLQVLTGAADQKGVEQIKNALDEWTFGENQEVGDFGIKANQAWFGNKLGSSAMDLESSAQPGQKGIMQNLFAKFGSEDQGGMNLYGDDEGGFYGAMDKIIDSLEPGAEAQDLLKAVMDDITLRQQKVMDSDIKGGKAMKDAKVTMDQVEAVRDLSKNEAETLQDANLMTINARLADSIDALNTTMEKLHKLQGGEGKAQVYNEKLAAKGAASAAMGQTWAKEEEKWGGLDARDKEDQGLIQKGFLKRMKAGGTSWEAEREGGSFKQRASKLAMQGGSAADKKALMMEYSEMVKDKNEAAAAQYYKDATTKGSIFVHDTHVEKILIALLSVMGGGAKNVAPLLEQAAGFQEGPGGGRGGILDQVKTAGTTALSGLGAGMGGTGGLMSMMSEKIATSVAGWTIPTTAELEGGAKGTSGTGEETEVAKQTSFLSLISDGIATLTGGLTSTGEKAATGEEGTEGGLFGRFDSKAFGESITMFSLSANSLAEALNSPLKIEVGGKVNMTVKIEGDEAFAKLSGEFEQLAVEKVNMGIKNFVKNMQRGDLTDSNWAGGNNQPTLGGGAGNTA